jgi:PAS domain S-box-containing protein
LRVATTLQRVDHYLVPATGGVSASITTLGAATAVAVVYFLFALLGLALLAKPSDVAVFWPASGIAAGLLIVAGRRLLAAVVIGVVLGTIAANLLSDRSLVTSTLKGFCNAGEAVLVAWLLYRWSGRSFTFGDIRSVVGFVGAAALATGISAVGGAVTMILSAQVAASFWEAWRTWFLSDGVGILVVAPFVVELGQLGREAPPREEVIEAVAVLFLLGLTAAYVVTEPADSWLSFTPAAPCAPMLLWLAARCRSSFAIGGALIGSSAIIVATTFGIGRFGDASVSIMQRVHGAQSSVTLLTIATLALAALFQRLRNQEAEFRRLLGALPAAIQTTDTAGRITYCNQAAVGLWGTRPKLGKDTRHDLYRLFYPDGTPMPEEDQPCQVALRERRIVRGQEAILERADGRRIPIIPCPSPLFDEAGRFVGMVNMDLDISERKNAERALAEREAQLALFVEHAPAGIAMFDREMRYLAVSRRYFADFDLPPDVPLIGRSHYEVFPDIPQRWRDVHARVFAGEELSQQEDQFTRENGRIVWTGWSMAPWRRDDGQIGGAILFTEVRTEQVEARRALAESEARFRATFENAAVGVALVGPDGSILRVNDSFTRILGYTSNELTTKTFQDITHPEDLEANISVLKKTLDGEVDSYGIEKRYIRKDGGIVWANLTVGCVRKADGAVDYFISVIENITDRKQAEARLAERNAQFELASKVARVGSFTCDYATGIVQLSPGSAVIYGLPEDRLEISLQEARALVHPDDLSRIKRATAAAFSQRQREILLHFRIVCHGEVRWIEQRILISYDESEKGMSLLGAVIDITERKQAEHALAERNAQFDLAHKAARVGCYTHDISAKTMRFSRASMATYGLSQSTMELTAQQWYARVHRDDMQRLRAEHIRAFKEQRPELVSEFRVVRPGGEARWIEARSLIAYDHAGRAERMTGVYIDVTERRQSEDHKSLLIAELDHRVKNVLACVAAVAQRSQECSTSAEEFLDMLNGRITSLSNAHALLSRGHWEGVALTELVCSELAFCTKDESALIEGPAVDLAAEATQPVAMVLHELVTNAAKYGALSNGDGRVSVSWRRQPNGGSGGNLVLEWRETGGPPVVAPNTPGYGTSVIRDLIPYELGGSVDFVLAPEGARCRLEIPAKWVSGSSRGRGAANGANESDTAS